MNGRTDDTAEPNAAQDAQPRDDEALREDLRRAVAHGAVVPHFQPQVDLDTGRLTGFEVLAHWPHPTRGPIPQAVLLALAEESGQIETLMNDVLREALRAARHWDPALGLAVKLTPAQWRSDGAIDRLLATLHDTGFAPGRLEVAISERALAGEPLHGQRAVRRLKSHGLRVVLDEVGRGASSLSQLAVLPIDRLKIDPSFVRSLQARPESAAVVHAIVGLGHGLDVATSADGIETLDDAEWLRGLGCEQGQGAFFALPVPASEVGPLIERMC